MKDSFTHVACAATLAMVAACGGKNPPLPTGQVKIKSAASALNATASTPICAHFTLQPFSPSSDGSPNPAGAPLSINSSLANATGGAGATDAIVGCIAGDNDTAGYNWGYIVTADTFSQCGSSAGTLGAALDNVFPKSQTFIVPVHCAAGVDVQVDVKAQVSIATPNAGGYVDISTSVNATQVQIGCKEADIGSTDGLLHFGESYIAGDGSVATGLVALDLGSPTQFGGTVNGPSGSVDTFYTGLVDPSSVNTVYQTFTGTCAGRGEQYAASRHAQCVSNNGGLPTGTSAQLADAFISLPGKGFAAVSVVSGGLQIYSSLGAAAPLTMTAGAGFTPAYNPLTTTVIPASDPSLDHFVVTGVYVDQGNPMQFLVAATAGDGTPYYGILSHGSGAWKAVGFGPVDGPAISCNGLYADAPGCLAPRSCPNGAGSRTALPNVPVPVATHRIYVYYSGPPGVQQSMVLTSANQPTNLTLNTALGFPTFGIRFATAVPFGTLYNVIVASAPANLTCIIPGALGNMGTTDVSLRVWCGPKTWSKLSGSGLMGNGIATDGTLWTWGSNYYNTLGVGIGGDAPSPTKIGTDVDWKQVASGSKMTVAVKNNGTVWAWGSTPAGIGGGTANLQPTPLQIGVATNWAQVATTSDSIAAIKTDGTLWQWGVNDATGANVLTPTQVGTATDWASVTGGVGIIGLWGNFLLTKVNHTAWAWGSNFAGAAPVQIGTGSSWASGAMGTSGVIYLIRLDGTLWAQGSNSYGELGDGTTVAKTSLVQVGTASNWAQVSAGGHHAVGLRTNGDLYAWGANNSGQLGNVTVVNASTPVLVGTGYTAFAAAMGADLSFGIKTDRSLWAWGSGANQNLGISALTGNVLSPTPIP